MVAAGIAPDDAAIDVDLYARTLLGWDRARLLTEQNGDAPAALEPRFSQWIERRSRREPSAYIVGVREFWGHDFRVTPDVLIPRPETEFIVEHALPLLRGVDNPRIADIGTGSGVLAVTIAREILASSVVATDISAEALAVAGHNANTPRRRTTGSCSSRRRISTASPDRSTSSSRTRRTSGTATSRRCRATCGTNPTSRCSAARTACATSRACSTRRRRS